MYIFFVNNSFTQKVPNVTDYTVIDLNIYIFQSNNAAIDPISEDKLKISLSKNTKKKNYRKKNINTIHLHFECDSKYPSILLTKVLLKLILKNLHVFRLTLISNTRFGS